jgi:Na+-driven multidrug efflux pump
MVGQNIGANNFDRVNRVIRRLFTVFIGVSAFESALIYVFRGPIYRFFITDPNVVSLGATYINYFVPFFPFFTVFQLSMSVLQAAGRTKAAMALSLVRLWGLRILIASVLYYVLHMGAVGIWLGLAIGNVLSAFLALVYISRGGWQQRIID